MNFTLITGLFDLYGDEEKVVFYVEQFKKIINLRLPTIVFVDSVYDKLILEYDWVMKIKIDLRELWCWRVVLNSWRLPVVRCKKKDTLEFLSAMNCKLELLDRARNHTNSEYLFWIDAGICKVVSEEKLQTIKTKEFYHKGLLAPGIWRDKMGVPLDSPSWRFCGGVAVAHRDSFSLKPFQMVLETLREGHRAVWEVNVWSFVEQMIPEAITWCQGGFNDSILNF